MAAATALLDDDISSSFLLAGSRLPRRSPECRSSRRRRLLLSIAAGILLFVGAAFVHESEGDYSWEKQRARFRSTDGPDVVESMVGVVAADDRRCSEAGATVLRAGGHAVDAAVAAVTCLGVVHPVSSGIGGGAFIVVHSSDKGETLSFDARECAPAAASTNMYNANPSAKSKGALAMGIPGEIAGLYAAWQKYGRLPWKDLFNTSIKLARDGFVIVPYLAAAIKSREQDILADPGLLEVFAPKGRILQTNDTCYNPILANSLELISHEGPQVLYNGSVGEKFIADAREAGGIATMEDMRSYKVEVHKAMQVDVMGYTVFGMPPPSSGTVGMAMVLNILNSYGSLQYLKGFLGLHRLIESLKHMLAMRMNIGDPDFVDVSKYVADMLSPSFGVDIRKKIFDNSTFDPSYYMTTWSLLNDHGTSHLCIVDADRNAVSLTTTINKYFGAKVLSRSTGIILNDEMDDFSIPGVITPDKLPPAPANFIVPGKRPLSSMTPLVILKDNQLAGVVGGSGGIFIMQAVIQIFLNYFILGMDALAAVQRPRVYHELIPNVVLCENWTVYDGETIALEEDARAFLEQRKHQLQSESSGSVVQFVVQDLKESFMSSSSGRERNRKILLGSSRNHVYHGMLTAVSDPRKDGSPVGL